jgi:regulator of nucleoside diphosphate kinase
MAAGAFSFRFHLIQAAFHVFFIGRVLESGMDRFALTKEADLMSKQAVYVTEHDLKRLRGLIDEAAWTGGRQRADVERLDTELSRRKLLASDEVPPDVITLNSRVQLFELDTGETLTCTLVLPDEADIGQLKISILSPVGLAMLGHRVGDVFDGPAPGGVRRLEVTAIWYQPEAVGDFS